MGDPSFFIWPSATAMQPILRHLYSRSGGAWVRRPTTWLPGRDLCKASGQTGTDSADWEWGSSLYPRVPLLGPGLHYPDFHKSARRQASLPEAIHFV